MGMRFKDVEYTPKFKDILRDDSDVLFIEGPTGTGKSLLAIFKLYAIAMGLPVTENKVALVGKDVPTLERNFVTGAMGITALFPNVEYKKMGTGGARIEVKTPTGLKYIELFGGDKSNSWEKLRGSTHKYYLIDEINLMHEKTIEELWARRARNRAKIVCTSNGDVPDHPIYKNFLNHCEPAVAHMGDIPATTMADMNAIESKDRWTYYFYGFDDNPRYTPEDIEALHQSVPKGSFAYITKILGMRGAQEGAVYAELLTNYGDSLWASTYDPNTFKEVFIGLDMGSGGKNIISATAIKPDFSGTLTLDSKKIDQPTHDTIIAEVNTFVEGFHSKFGTKISHYMIDDGLKHFINRLNLTKQHKHIRCQFAVKPKHVDRVAYWEQALHNKTHQFYDTPGNRELVMNLNKIMTDGKGGVDDKNKEPNDWYDAWCYTVTPRMPQLIKYNK